MTRELKRDGLLVQVRTHGEGVDVQVELSGLRIKQFFEDLEKARNQVCGLAREIAYTARTTGEKTTESRAAQHFHFMREVRL
jgi:hypothetical protein